jgi:phosphatidylethanolamine-binding protein (PEBP) family uncharacterized protein
MTCEIDREKDRMKFPVFLFKSEGNISKIVLGLTLICYAPLIGRHRYFHRLYALDKVLPNLKRPAKGKGKT